MSEAKKVLIERALASLEAKNNEPLNWLIGDALREHSDWPAHPHFLLTALSRPRTGSLALWNASIHEFRRLLTNPSAAPQKAMGDLRSSGQDADNRLRSLFAEVQTVLVLKKGGFTNFAVVPPSKVAMPDFTATFERNRARVEVKNLREPSDQLRTVAAEEWEKQRSSQPCRYNFHAALRHSSTGAISAAAEKRLRTIIRQFPDMKRPLKETLDGGISVQMERLDGSTNPPDGFLHARILKDAEPGRIVIVSSFRQEHLDPNVLELQRLFLKAIRIIVCAQTKFFAKETLDEEALNVIALRWEIPEIFYDPAFIEHTQSQIEQLYANFGLRLKVVIFPGTGPDLPLELLKRYQ